MMTDDEKTYRDLNRVARRCAHRLHSMSNKIIDYEDARMEALTWLYEHPQEVERRRDEQGELYASDLYAAAMRHMIRWGRREMREVFRMDLRIQTFYDVQRIEAVLHHAWANESVTMENESGIRTPKDPATGGNLKAVVVDIKRALRSAVNKKDRAILFARYCLGQTWEVAGQPHQLTANAARMRGERAIEDMRDYLNGFRPVPQDMPGARQAMSNATARVVTDRGGSGEPIPGDPLF